MNIASTASNPVVSAPPTSIFNPANPVSAMSSRMGVNVNALPQQTSQQPGGIPMSNHHVYGSNVNMVKNGPPNAAESPIPKQWWDQDANKNPAYTTNTRNPTSTALVQQGQGQGQGQPVNSSYSSYYANAAHPPQPPPTQTQAAPVPAQLQTQIQNQPQQETIPSAHVSNPTGKATAGIPRPYPNTYPTRSSSPGPSHLIQQSTPNQTSQAPQAPQAHIPITYNNNSYNYRDSSLPPNSRNSSVPPPPLHRRDGRDGRDGSLPPTLRNPNESSHPASSQPPPRPPSSTGLIRITLCKPMGIVFEPIPAESPSTQPQRGVRICELPRTGAAALSRKLEVGDELLSINDKTMSRLTFDEIMDFIIEADAERVNLLFRRPRKEEVGNSHAMHTNMHTQRKGVSPYNMNMGTNVGNPVPLRTTGSSTKVKWIDEKDGDSNSRDYKDSKDTSKKTKKDIKERPREKLEDFKKKRRNKKTETDSLLDMLIDNLCSPLVQGTEAAPCVQNYRKKNRRDEDSDSEDEGTYVSYDSSTYLTYDSSTQQDTKRKPKLNKKSDEEDDDDDDDEETYSVDEGSTLETDEDRALRRKKFQERKYGMQDSANDTLSEPHPKQKMAVTKDPPIGTAYEDDATLETVETFEHNKNVENSSYIPQRPLGLSEEPKLVEQTIDENKVMSTIHPPKSNVANLPNVPNVPLPIEELEYDDQIDGGDVSVMTPSLVDFTNSQAQVRGDYSLPGMQMDESLQKSPTKFYRHVVKHLLETHEPEKVRLLDKLLAKYENREEHLIQKLTVRYNRKTEADNPPTINEEEPYSDKDSQKSDEDASGTASGTWDTTDNKSNNETETRSETDGEDMNDGDGDGPSEVITADEAHHAHADHGSDSEEDDFDRVRRMNASLSKSGSYSEDEPGHVAKSIDSTTLDKNIHKSFDSMHSNQSKTVSSQGTSHTEQREPIGDDEESTQSGSVYSDDDYSGSSIDGTSPAVIAQVSELLNFVYGKTSVPGQIDRVSTIMRAYEGRESVLLELLETKALIKASTQNEQSQKDIQHEQSQEPNTAQSDRNNAGHMNVNGPSIAVDGDGARDDISSVSAGSHSRGTRHSISGKQMDLIESRMENDAVLLRDNRPNYTFDTTRTSTKQINTPDKTKQDAVAKIVKEQNKKSAKKKGLFGFLKRKKKNKPKGGGFPKKKGLQAKLDEDDYSM